jgi:hypothetical protein
VRKYKKKYKWLKLLFLIVANLGAFGVVVFTMLPVSKEWTHQIIYSSYAGMIIFATARYAIEKYRINIGIRAVNQIID